MLLIRETIIFAYVFAVAVFLVLLLLSDTARKRRITFLNRANFIILIVLVLQLGWVAREALSCNTIRGESNSDHFGVVTRQNCFSTLIATFLFAFVFQAFFFFRKYRVKISFSILSVLLLGVLFNYERIVIFITSMYRDYLPSSWSVYYDYTDISLVASATILYFVVCWVQSPKSITILR
jgi:hypothetical protein